MANIASRLSQPCAVPTVSSSAASALPTWQTRGDEAAVEQVEQLPGDHRHRHDREELHQPDEAEIERIVGQLVDLPADRDALHHEGAVAEGARAPEQHERAMARQALGGGSVGHSWIGPGWTSDPLH